jgi:urease gamma subunit
MPQSLTIDDACKTVHQWAELLRPGATGRSVPGDLPEAVATIKAYLERERTDGKPIQELVIADELLMTREGVRWVMPFVLSAEKMLARELGKRMN